MVTWKSLTILLFFLCIELTSESSSYFFSLITMILSNLSENSNYIYSKVFIWLLELVSLRISIPIGKSGASLSWPHFLKCSVILSCVFTFIFENPYFPACSAYWSFLLTAVEEKRYVLLRGRRPAPVPDFQPQEGLNTGKGEGLPPNWSS